MCVKKLFVCFPWVVTSTWPGRVYKLRGYFMTKAQPKVIEPATSEVSHMRRFKSYAARLCDKDYKFMSWVT